MMQTKRGNGEYIQVLFVGVVILILSTSISYATTLRKLSLNKLVAHADTVVIGQCERTETIYIAKKIYTIAIVQVDQSVKGKVAAKSKIKVYILGGTVKEPMPVKMHVPGAAKVSQDEEMILFLKAGGPRKEHHRFVGMAQGKVPVTTDPNSGGRIIHYGEPIKDVKFVDRQGNPIPQGSNPEPAKEDTIEDFIDRVKKNIAEQEAQAQKVAKQIDQPKNAMQNKKGSVK